MDEVVLQYSPETERVEMEVVEVNACCDAAVQCALPPTHSPHTLRTARPTPAACLMHTRPQVSPPNQEHKKRCMLGVLEEAVAAYNGALAALLAGRELRFIVETEDFGVAWRGEKHRLPAFAMCTGACMHACVGLGRHACMCVHEPSGASVCCPLLLEPTGRCPPCLPLPRPADSQHSDIPVPDFTYNCYPETRYKNSSWPAIQELLQRKSDMLHWHERHSALFHRSNWGVGPRRGLMPLLQSYANGSGATPSPLIRSVAHPTCAVLCCSTALDPACHTDVTMPAGTALYRPPCTALYCSGGERRGGSRRRPRHRGHWVCAGAGVGCGGG